MLNFSTGHCQTPKYTTPQCSSQRRLVTACPAWRMSSEAYLAEISVRSPRKLFIFVIGKYMFRKKNYPKTFKLNLKKTSLKRPLKMWCRVQPNEAFFTEMLDRSPRQSIIFITQRKILHQGIHEKIRFDFEKSVTGLHMRH